VEAEHSQGSGQVNMSMTWNEILVLVERAKTGDRTAYGELVRHFEPTVYAVALARLRDPLEAQELTQEVFIHGMTKLAQLRDAACFAGWLRQIAVRMAINRLTRRSPFQGAEPEVLANHAAEGSTPLEGMVRSEECAALMVGLKQLKPLDRATLEAFYIHGRSLKQMSREFETPVGTIKRRLHVARKRLKKHLESGKGGKRGRRKGRRRELELACV
jgi:RNA polymerase sigma-70 factor (ECF subfamily)